MHKEIIKKGIIEPINLHTMLEDPHVKILDATFVLPGSSENPRAAWEKQRIGNAAFFDIEKIADKNTDLPHMLPSAQEFESTVSDLGIGNDDFVIVYGQSGMVMGPARVWWTFRVFGHDKICVLNGGLPAWLAAGYEMNEEPPEASRRAAFKAKINPSLVCDMAAVRKTIAAGDGKTQILDARPPARFNAETPEPREGLSSGHIPGSCNVPAGALVQARNGKLREGEDLHQFLIDSGFQPGKPVITTCGSGVTACVISLALHNQGFSSTVYDGSWAEWGKKDLKNPIEAK